MSRKAAVIVAGSWGTAVASVLADNGVDVTLWTRNPEQADEINCERTNRRYLPQAKLSPRIRATVSIEEAVRDASCIVLTAPSGAMREVAARLKPFLSGSELLIHAAKGLELGTHKRMSEVIAEELPQFDPARIVALSGPSHAEEVIVRSPTTVVVAARDREAAESAQDWLINSVFRVYTNPDVVGVELGGALKNIIALGAGLSDGLGFGDNAKAALLTRGLAEIVRLGRELGARPMTFSGLAGIGDLVVTCTSRHSRNWKAGYLIGQGRPPERVLAEMNMVVEGVRATRAAYELSVELGVSMPITAELYQVLFEGKPPRDAVESLMRRNRTHEMEELTLG